MIRSLKPDTQFSPEQVSLRNAIGERLSAGLQAPMAIQLLLANFLYSPPGLLQIADAEASCLIGCWPTISLFMSRRRPTFKVSSKFSLLPNLPQPDFGVFPTTLQELVGNRIQLNRLLGLVQFVLYRP